MVKSSKALDKKLDKAWAVLVKLIHGSKCEKCGKSSPLNSHHIYSRSNRSTRWDLSNGSCLCVGCHTFSSKFSAHKTPIEFIEFIKAKRGERWYNLLRLKANSMSKIFIFEKEALLEDLNKQIKEYN